MKDSLLLKVSMSLLALVLIVFVGVKTRNALQEYNYIGTSGRDTISISGEGKVSAQPDLVVVNLGVTTESATVKDGQTQNTQKMNAIIAALKALGIADNDIQTADYSIYPKYNYTDGKQTLDGYAISQQITAKVRNLDSVGDVLAKSADLGANEVNGLSFTIDDPTQLQAQARDKALADARTKADAVAKTLGLTIVKVVTFSESTNYPPGPIPYMADKAFGIGGGGGTPPTVQSGSLDVTSDVLVTFEVR